MASKKRELLDLEIEAVKLQIDSLVEEIKLARECFEKRKYREYADGYAVLTPYRGVSWSFAESLEDHKKTIVKWENQILPELRKKLAELEAIQNPETHYEGEISEKRLEGAREFVLEQRGSLRRDILCSRLGISITHDLNKNLGELSDEQFASICAELGNAKLGNYVLDVFNKLDGKIKKAIEEQIRHSQNTQQDQVQPE